MNMVLKNFEGNTYEAKVVRLECGIDCGQQNNPQYRH
jgi:hypothetical protein